LYGLCLIEKHGKEEAHREKDYEEEHANHEQKDVNPLETGQRAVHIVQAFITTHDRQENLEEWQIEHPL
jgi:hypothetical protein